MPRVKISKTVDLEDIPNEVVKYLKETEANTSLLNER